MQVIYSYRGIIRTMNIFGIYVRQKGGDDIPRVRNSSLLFVGGVRKLCPILWTRISPNCKQVKS